MTIDKLGFEELLIYSAILVELTLLLKSDEELRYSIQKPTPMFLEFHVNFTLDYIALVRYYKKEKQFSYGNILIPKGILDHIIEY